MAVCVGRAGSKISGTARPKYGDGTRLLGSRDDRARHRARSTAVRVKFVGTEDAGTRKAYHLRLRPLLDPAVHNLRDLWVDTITFDVLAAHFASRYSPRPGLAESPSDVTEYFTQIGRYRIADRIVFTYRNSHVSELSDVTIARVAFPESLPDWLFDQKLFDAQRRAGEPNILWEILNGSPATPTPS